MELCYNVQTCASHSSLEQDLQLCRQAGFHAVEINFQRARDYLKSHTLDDLANLMKKHEMRCASINAIFSINFCAPSDRERILSELEFACDLGEATGADRVIVLSNERKDLPMQATPQQIFDDTVSSLRAMAEAGAKRNMKIAFEPVGTMAIGDIATAWSVVKAVDRPDVGLVVDDFNLYLWDLGSDFDEIRKIPSEKIFMVHINDAESIPFALLDQDHRCMPGDGRIDVAKYMDCIRACGYDGTVSIEVLNSRIWERGPESVIPEAYEKIRKFVA